ncbi:sodium-dependent transporter [Anaerosporobacter faecicola]|uniref:sodium-dependent transporter n=1 Tax=Anaerosporobacter faecicola TaxID=2718714 RepID=UPI00143AB29E|nr:sodium-dependent transporter [Anaerosporobacter faecicola]
MSDKKKTASKGFSGKMGYVLAVAGSAVGLGNIWRFPYLAAKYGGGIFLLTYLILAVTFGFTLIMTETALGRRTGKSPIGAYRALGAKKMMFGGWINAIIPMLIVPYYCVIGGWVCKYFFSFLGANASQLQEDTYFTNFVSKPIEPLFWLLFFAIAVFVIIARGVEKRIEQISKILMPLLVLMAFAIAIYSVTREGALEGVKYYLIPNFKQFSIKTVVAAMGQMFYSLSIGMGILYTYGSYMKKDIDMESSIRQVELVDSIIAILAGLMIIPAVFAFAGGNPETLQAGPSLMFITMPKVFLSMPMGRIVGMVFFLLVFSAALTSAISLMESGVSTITEQTNWSRKKSTVIMLGIIIILGIPSSLGFGVLSFLRPLGGSILDFFDFITNSIMMPIAASCTVILVMKVCGFKVVIDEVKSSSKFRRKGIYLFIAKYLVLLFLAVILISSILTALGITKI